MAAENTPTIVQLGIPTDQPRSQHDGLQSFSSYCQYCAIKQILLIECFDIDFPQVKDQSPWQGYHSLLEVVLMRDSVWNFLDKK